MNVKFSQIDESIMASLPKERSSILKWLEKPLSQRYLAVHNDHEIETLDVASDGLSFADKKLLDEVIQKMWSEGDHGPELRVNFKRLQKPALPPKTPMTPQNSPLKKSISGVQRVYLVSSGKGGVGKSSVAVNLALGLRRQSLQVGIFDADLFGPSLPEMLGLKGTAVLDDKLLKPFEVFGLKAMSFGVFSGRYAPFSAKGPQASRSLLKLLHGTAWGELDALVIDMPPGTSDIPLTLAEELEVEGAVLVTTPQGIALQDVHKGLSLFEKHHVPVIGLVENMSFYECPHCQHRDYVFGQETRSFLEKRQLPLLGRIPLDARIGQYEQAGQPVSEALAAYTAIYDEIAQRVWQAF